jgi:hypothetical protein
MARAATPGAHGPTEVSVIRSAALPVEAGVPADEAPETYPFTV